MEGEGSQRKWSPVPGIAMETVLSASGEQNGLPHEAENR